ASGLSADKSLLQPTINSSAPGSRSLLRKGDGSIELNNCFSSATCTSMIAHFGGIASPVEAFSVVTESSQELRRRLSPPVLRLCSVRAATAPKIKKTTKTHTHHTKHNN